MIVCCWPGVPSSRPASRNSRGPAYQTLRVGGCDLPQGLLRRGDAVRVVHSELCIPTLMLAHPAVAAVSEGRPRSEINATVRVAQCSSHGQRRLWPWGFVLYAARLNNLRSRPADGNPSRIQVSMARTAVVVATSLVIPRVRDGVDSTEVILQPKALWSILASWKSKTLHISRLGW
jgi:hypothetical protein